MPASIFGTSRRSILISTAGAPVVGRLMPSRCSGRLGDAPAFFFLLGSKGSAGQELWRILQAKLLVRPMMPGP